MQHREDNREQYTENNTENSTHISHAQDTTQSCTYSYDLYHEQICIKNSNTIELYTISKENI